MYKQLYSSVDHILLVINYLNTVSDIQSCEIIQDR